MTPSGVPKRRKGDPVGKASHNTRDDGRPAGRPSVTTMSVTSMSVTSTQTSRGRTRRAHSAEQIVSVRYFGDYKQLIPLQEKHNALVATAFHQGIAGGRGWSLLKQRGWS